MQPSFSPAANDALAVVANILSAAISLSPLLRIHQLVKRQSTGQSGGVPYQILWFSSALWLLYGCRAQLIAVAAINAFGVIMGLTYVLIWTSWLPVNDRSQRLLHYSLLPVLFTFILVLLLGLWFAPLVVSEGDAILGILAAVVSVLFACSPLAVLCHGNLTVLDPVLATAITIATLFWTLYGVGIGDIYITVSNAIECGVGLLQLVLYVLGFAFCDHLDETDM